MSESITILFIEPPWLLDFLRQENLIHDSKLSYSPNASFKPQNIRARTFAKMLTQTNSSN